MRYRITSWLIGLMLVVSLPVGSATLSDIQVSNGNQQARITFSFSGEPVYSVTRQGERIVAIDIRQSGVIQGLPLQFSGNNLVRSIRAGNAPDSQTLRLLVDMTQKGTAQAAKRQSGATTQLVFTLNADAPPPPVVVQRQAPVPAVRYEEVSAPAPEKTPARNPFNSNKSATTAVINSNTVTRPVQRVATSDKIIVAIDAGHGGQDPGAIGAGGTKEKNVTLAVAHKLRDQLNADPMFKGVLTRTGDYFISVMGRSDVARRQNANLLISIHADAAPNRDVTGASVWVLSNRRANTEMAGWLEQHEKQSELLGGAGDVLANSQADPYLSEAVLDLQFGHSQRVGYDVASKVLGELRQIGDIHMRRPQHASLGVLRSPDIPSLLVETGFISNSDEERLLSSSEYQQRLAVAIYQGLRDYFVANPLQSAPPTQTASMDSGQALETH